MDKTLDVQQIPTFNSKLPVVIAILVVGGLIASYAFLCKYIGERTEAAMRRELKASNMPPIISVSEPKVNRGWFGTSFEFTVTMQVTAGNMVGIRAKSHAQHLPIPFGPGWGRLVTNDTVIELDEATKTKFAKKLPKPPKVLVRSSYHINRTTSFQVRAFPFLFRSKNDAIEIARTGKIEGKLDAVGLLSSLSMLVPELVWNDARRSIKVNNLRLAQRTTGSEVQLNLDNMIKAEHLEISPPTSTYSTQKAIKLKSLAMDIRVKNLSRKALMVLLGEENPLSTLALSAKSPVMQPREYLNLLKASPNIAIDIKKISLSTPDGSYDFNGTASMGDQQMQMGSPFGNLKLQMNLNMPVAGVDRLFPATDHRSTVRKLIRSGWVAKQGGRYVSVVNYENRKLEINQTQVNPRSLQPFR